MTSSSVASTSTVFYEQINDDDDDDDVSSTSQYSAETLLAILERPNTSLSQSVGMETPDLEVILPTRPFVHLCDPKAVTLPLHSTPMEPTINLHP